MKTVNVSYVALVLPLCQHTNTLDRHKKESAFELWKCHIARIILETLKVIPAQPACFEKFVKE